MPGILTVVRSGRINAAVERFGCNHNLAEVCSRKNIDRFIYQNPSQFGTTVSTRLKATTVEALVGAVWFDSGDINVAERVMSTLGVLSPPVV